MIHWFTYSWWKYLLAAKADEGISWFTTIHCRSTGHRCGPVYYNPTGLEPDMTCKKCGDDLG